jgi:hypothetical protein
MEAIYSVETAGAFLAELRGANPAPFFNACVSTLGGTDRASILITASTTPREQWVNGILENSTYFRLHLSRDGTAECFSGHQLKRWRKCKVKSAADLAERISKHITANAATAALTAP